MGAAHLADRDFNRISDGQRQRVLLARAICQQPEVILLDEPTSFLDIKGKIELLTILKELAHTGQLAVILSLHELELAEKIADTVVCVSPGGVSGVLTRKRPLAGEHPHPVCPDRTAVHSSVRHTGAGSRKGTRRKAAV